MSSPSLGYPTSGGRRLSVSSQGSHREAPAADLNDDAKRLSSSVGSVSHREPIRSFIHGSDRGYLAPLDSALSARSVREETAELANYVLSDKKDGRGSPLLRRARSASSHAGRRSRTISTPELASPEISPAGPAGPADTINEVSEPPSPDAVDEQAAGGPSMLTTMLRRSRPDTRFPVAPKQEERRENGVSAEDGKYAAVGTAKAPSPEPRPLLSHRDTDEEASETSPLLAVRSRESHRSHVEGHADGHGVVDLEGQKYLNPKKWLGRAAESIRGTGSHLVSVIPIINKPKRWDRRALWQNVFVAPVVCLPAVTVGVLLNILDALSYGMILFPLGNPIFSNLGSAGISIFYVSTIIAQLTFSCGSIFKGGIGSELIEVVPFFHNMAGTITDVVGQDKPDAVIATVITSYALSSMLTGAVFFLMGQFKFGYLVGFIPRHILIGCIGGVGWFLIATGFEVTARMDRSFNYDLETLKRLVQADTIPLWIIPLTLAVILFYAQSRVTSKYFLPLYILIIPAGFYALAAALDRLNPDKLRDNGWVFDGPPAGEPWWYFYTLYKFRQVHWGAIAQCIPAMFALTFFSCLHVPINVPTLALNTGEDDANLDHELKLHGYSNLLSGLAGSIQNYLVYSNSLFFMRSGGNSRLAGIELAIFTFVVMVVGPPVIGFIPVMMVGTLIFVLGFELLLEAVWQPRRKLKSLEYITVFAIVLVMGTYDFVVGIGVGILLAFVSLIIQTSRVSAVRASYSGDVVGSTVRRNPTQQHYLRQVGHQIEIIKLSGYLFFGTIVSVEDKIRGLIAEEEFRGRPFTFLILDLWLVTGLDYSAAEVFNTISRLLNSRDIESVISGVDPEHGLGRTLRAVGLGEDGIEVKLLPELNSALEYCENELLKTFYANEEDPLNSGGAPTGNLDVPNQRSSLGQPADMLGSSPRRVLLHEAARKSLGHVQVKGLSRWQSFKEPLRLMLQIFHEVSDRNEDFWFRAVGYFRRSEYAAGTVLFRRGEPAEGFYLVESGILRAEYDLPQGWLFESIVAGTTCGELPFFSETERTATCVVERDCVVWLMDRESWARLQKEEPDVAQELLRISLKLTSERLSSITSYVLTMAG